jgi:phosphate transport system substrate-binding protein
MRARIGYSFYVAALSVAFGTAGLAAGEEIKVGGGGAAMSTVFHPIKPQFEKATGVTVLNLQSSPKDGLADLLAGKVDVATAAVPLDGMVAGVTKDGVKVDPAALVKHEIGTNRTVLFVHPSNTVGKLSKAQIKGIFSGKISNWRDVGGDDREIVVVWGKATPGQNAQFSLLVLDGEPVAKDVLESTNYAKIKETVSATPEAIGIDPFGMADGTVKVVESDPVLTSPIIAVTLGQPSPKVKKLLDYVRGEGKVHTRQ